MWIAITYVNNILLMASFFIALCCIVCGTVFCMWMVVLWLATFRFATQRFFCRRSIYFLFNLRFRFLYAQFFV